MNQPTRAAALRALVTGLALGCGRESTSDPEPGSACERQAITTELLEPYECRTIARLHTYGRVGGVRTVINLRHADEVTGFDERHGG